MGWQKTGKVKTALMLFIRQRQYYRPVNDKLLRGCSGIRDKLIADAIQIARIFLMRGFIFC